MWSVPPPSIDDTRASYKDVASIHPSPLLVSLLSTLLKSRPDAVLHTLPPWPDHPFPRQSEELKSFLGEIKEKTGVVTDGYLLRALHLARLIKTAPEISLIRKANHISSRAHEVCTLPN